jgi:hypothetical protein
MQHLRKILEEELLGMRSGVWTGLGDGDLTESLMMEEESPTAVAEDVGAEC